ncbi:MAG: tyrosine-type recombinase/integrase [Clostridium sp.]|nr:tyrosine-type recombinase/integrase [Clostridium sp.]
MSYLDLYKEELNLKGKRVNTIESINNSIDTFQKYLQIKDIELNDATINNITVQDAFSYRKYLLDRGYKRSTVNTKIANIKSYFGFLVKHEIIIKNPFAGFEAMEENDKTIKDILTKEEVIKLIESFGIKLQGERNFEYISKRNKAIIAVLASTGVRIENLLNVTMDKLIKIEEGYKIEYAKAETKGKVDTTIYIVGKNKELLEDYLKVRKDKSGLNLLFNSAGANKKISRSDMITIINKRVEYLGIQKHIVSHSFRAYTANALLSNGAEPIIIRKMLGWSNNKQDMLSSVYYRNEAQEKQIIEYSQILWK